MIVPRWDRLIPTLQTLPYTRTNPSVAIFRQAMAIDERRRLFRLNRWVEPQPFVANRFDKDAPHVDQNIRQVWFAGVHSDIGGGYPENESGLSKFPLNWLIEEAKRANYDAGLLRDSGSFQVGDVLFTAIFAVASDLLASLASTPTGNQSPRRPEESSSASAPL